MPIDPIKIPQNVYIEDRIIGPLTLKQVIVSAIGCGFSYALYATLAKAYGALSVPLTVMVWVPGAVSMFFAFVKINDLSMIQICLLMLERLNKPGIRVWAPRRGLMINIKTSVSTDPKAKSKAAAQPPKNTDHIDALSVLLDTMPKRQAAQEPSAIAEEDPMTVDTTQSPAEAIADDSTADTMPPDVETAETNEEQPRQRPVDPSRIQASPLDPALSTDTVAAGKVSIFTSR